ncbi:hypothetical protein MHAS_02293 [Mycolicibacterium hassiacum DSM 44199]|nr:hypothetical protein MHAS_02293 [Mycolicibacterium hassiacum DSM 44199]
MNSAKPTLWEMTDTANADRLIDHAAGKLLYCADMGRWLAWDGTRWQISGDDGPAWQAARQAIDSIQCGDSELLAKHKLRSLSENRLGAMVRLAMRDNRMRVEANQLDGDPYALNTPGGVIDLRTGRVAENKPNLLHTKITGCGVAVMKVDPGRVDLEPLCPMWTDYLYDTFGGDEYVIGYVQELAGIAAIGEVSSNVFPFLHGPGGNGKTVLTDVLLKIFGDYAEPCPNNFLLAGRERHETEIAELRGLRLAISSEINKGSVFDEAKVKLLTGGDMLKGRFMRKDFFKFTPSHSLWLVGNYKPEVPSGGNSFWRRLRLIPFDYKVPEGKRDEHLAKKLVDEEGPQILAWIAAGAHRYLNCGGLSDTPQAVVDATGEYASQEDPITRFIEECCDEHAAGEETKSGTVHAAYERWASESGEKKMSAVEFSKAMADAGHKSRRDATGSKRIYPGLRVKQEHLPMWSSEALSAKALSRN